MKVHQAQRLPRTVVVLGLVSLLMDTSSEMIHALLPVFLVAVAGATPLMIGIIEGIAEATAMFAKVVAGFASDRLGRRKPLVMAGYGLAALSKPLFALAPGVGLVLVARVSDRLGKGIRGAPRDALIADITPPQARGSAFGLRQSLDTLGAVAGPLLAVMLMALSNDNIRLVFWLAGIPAVLCLVLLWRGVDDIQTHGSGTRPLLVLQRLSAGFWIVLLIGFTFQLSRFSEAFLLLRAEGLGWQWAQVPLVLVAINVAYALTAWPAGRLSDRVGRQRLLIPALLVLIVADLVLAQWTSVAGLLVGAALWGVHLGLSSGVLAAMVSDVTRANERGSAFGIFNLASGIALLLASLVAGFVWQHYAPQVTFYVGAATCGLTLLLLLALPGPANRAVGVTGQD